MKPRLASGDLKRRFAEPKKKDPIFSKIQVGSRRDKSIEKVIHLYRCGGALRKH
jgi:hypothetical protein